MRIPGGILIPDGSDSGGCLGALLGMAVVALLPLIIIESCNRQIRSVQDSQLPGPSRISVPPTRATHIYLTSPAAPGPSTATVCAPELFWDKVVNFIVTAREGAIARPQQGSYESTSEFEERRLGWDSTFRTELDSVGASIGTLTVDIALLKQEYFPDVEQLRVTSERLPIPTGLLCEVGPVPSVNCRCSAGRRFSRPSLATISTCREVLLVNGMS